jgi:hypothetical protein
MKGTTKDPQEPTKTDYNLADEYEKVTCREELMMYRKLKNEQKERKPKLYANIFLEAVNRNKKVVRN